MRVVLINSWYKQYSTGKLVASFREFLIHQGVNVKTYYGHGEKTKDADVIRILSKWQLNINAAIYRIMGYEWISAVFSTWKMIKEIERYKPDVVYLFNLHAYYLNENLFLRYLKNKHIKVVYMLFDEYPYLGKCCFAGSCEKYKVECNKCPQVKTYPISLFFDKSRHIFLRKKRIYENWPELSFAGVEFLMKQSSASALGKNIPFHVLDMGVQLKTMYYPRKHDKLREKLNIPINNKVVITVGPYSDPRKGINKFFEIAQLCKNDPITFINVGFDGNTEDVPDNVIPIRYVSNQDELATYYSLADIYVMTSNGEAMSLTCMEALGCGTKIIGFDVSGTPYAATKEFGVFVEYDNLPAFADAICNMPRKDDNSVAACRQYALSRYEISDFVYKLACVGGVISEKNS